MSARLTPLRISTHPYLLLVILPIAAQLPGLLGYVHADPSLLWLQLVPQQPSSPFGAPYIDGNTAITVQALGGLAAYDWLHGIIPWWNPYAGVGLPLAAEMQPQAFFLPFVLLLSQADGVMYMKITLQVIAGLATYLALRERGLLPASACIGGVLFEMNGTFAWYSDAPIMPIAFLPLLIFGIERTRRGKQAGQVGGPAIVAIAVAFSLTAGFPEVAYIDGLLATIWAADALIRVPPAPGRYPRARFSLGLILGVACALCLASPAWIPFVVYLQHASLGLHALVEFAKLPARQAITMFVPYIFGPLGYGAKFENLTSAGGFVDATCMFLAILSLLPSRIAARDRSLGLRWALTVWIVYSLATVCGQPQTMWLRRFVPLLAEATFCRYALPSISFAASVLAAMAVQDWLTVETSPHRRRTIGIAVSITMLGLATTAAMAQDRLRPGSLELSGWTAGSLCLMFGTMSASAGLLAAVANRRRAAILTMLLVSQAVVFFLPPVLAQSRSANLDMAPIAYLQTHLHYGRVYATDHLLYQNYGSFFGFGQIEYSSIPVDQNWADYVNRHIDPAALPGNFGYWFGNDRELLDTLLLRRTALEQAGVTHALVATVGDPLRQADPSLFKRVFSDERTSIYQLPQAKPYFEVRGAACTLRVESREKLVAQCDGPASLVRRELISNGWQSRVNGHGAKIHAVDGIFQQIGLPAGSATIAFRYAPPLANLIAVLFALGGVGLVVMLAAPAYRPKYSHASNSFLRQREYRQAR